MPDEALRRLANMRRPANWLIAVLESGQASEGTGRYDPGWIHPSDLSSECDAFIAFRYLGAPAKQVIEPKLQRIFDYGNIRESYLRHYLQVAGVSVLSTKEERQIVIPHLHIRGEMDDLVKHPLSGELHVIDYKTMHMDRFEKLDAAVPGHFLQVQPYQFATNVFKAFIIYECKNDNRLKAFPANFDGKVWEEQIVQRIHRILTGLQQDQVFRNPAHCTGCPFFANGVCTNNQIKKLKEESGIF